MQAKYGILIRGLNGQLLARVTDYTSLSILDTLNDVGSWNLQSTSQESCPFQTGDGIIVVRDGH